MTPNEQRLLDALQALVARHQCFNPRPLTAAHFAEALMNACFVIAEFTEPSA